MTQYDHRCARITVTVAAEGRGLGCVVYVAWDGARNDMKVHSRRCAQYRSTGASWVGHMQESRRCYTGAWRFFKPPTAKAGSVCLTLDPCNAMYPGETSDALLIVRE